MPQIQQLESTILSQVFWLVVCFALLFFFLRSVALPKVAEVLDARRRKIEGDLEKAAALKADAEKVLAEYQAAMAQSREQAQALLRKVGDEAQAQAARQQEALIRRLGDELKAAEARIAAARKAAIGQIDQLAAEAAQAATERLIGVKVDQAAVAKAVSAVRGQSV